MDRIVVGIDGSPHAERALHWALDEAERRGAKVEAVSVHPAPMSMYAVPMEAVVYTGVTREKLDDASRGLLQRTVERALGGRDIEVDQIVAEGTPSGVLKDTAKGADLLVVGTHGRGAIRGSLMGSVTLKVIHDPPCPVVAVPLSETHV